jgi:hypothetical protein
MKHHTRLTALALVVLFSVTILGVCQQRSVAFGLSVGDLLKLFGIGYVVKKFGPEIDRFINKALGTREAQAEGATKVVPIVRVGHDTAVGAAQVTGVPDKVKQVEAVAEVEVVFQDRFRARGLIPVDTQKVTTVKGIGGTGVSAIIDFPL